MNLRQVFWEHLSVAVKRNLACFVLRSIVTDVYTAFRSLDCLSTATWPSMAKLVAVFWRVVLYTKGRFVCDNHHTSCGRYIIPRKMSDVLPYWKSRFLSIAWGDSRPTSNRNLHLANSNRTLNAILFTLFGTLHVNDTRTGMMVFVSTFESPWRCLRWQIFSSYRSLTPSSYMAWSRVFSCTIKQRNLEALIVLKMLCLKSLLTHVQTKVLYCLDSDCLII